MQSFLWLDQLRQTDQETVGMKALALGQLRQMGFAVPNGFVIPASRCQDFWGEVTGSRPLLMDFPNSTLRLDVDDSWQLRQVARSLQAALREQAWPQEWIAALETALGQLNSPMVMVRPCGVMAAALQQQWYAWPRSSHPTPGSPERSSIAQGLVQPVLRSSASLRSAQGRTWDNGPRPVAIEARVCPGSVPFCVAQIKQIWASLFQASSLLCWQRHGIPLESVGVAVLVQALRPAHLTGTLTLEQRDTQIEVQVEACRGLGFALTRGEVMPDRYVWQGSLDPWVESEDRAGVHGGSISLTGTVQHRRLGYQSFAYTVVEPPVQATKATTSEELAPVQAMAQATVQATAQTPAQTPVQSAAQVIPQSEAWSTIQSLPQSTPQSTPQSATPSTVQATIQPLPQSTLQSATPSTVQATIQPLPQSAPQFPIQAPTQPDPTAHLSSLPPASRPAAAADSLYFQLLPITVTQPLLSDQDVDQLVRGALSLAQHFQPSAQTRLVLEWTAAERSIGPAPARLPETLDEPQLEPETGETAAKHSRIEANRDRSPRDRSPRDRDLTAPTQPLPELGVGAVPGIRPQGEALALETSLETESVLAQVSKIPESEVKLEVKLESALEADTEAELDPVLEFRLGLGLDLTSQPTRGAASKPEPEPEAKPESELEPGLKPKSERLSISWVQVQHQAIAAPASGAPSGQEQVYRGEGASMGQVQGRAWLGVGDRSSQSGPDGQALPWEEQVQGPMPHHGILVVPQITAALVPLLSECKGVVTEQGGLTSHGALLARELQIPAVVGVVGITQRLQSGDWVEVDGDRGQVRLITTARAMKTKTTTTMAPALKDTTQPLGTYPTEKDSTEKDSTEKDSRDATGATGAETPSAPPNPPIAPPTPAPTQNPVNPPPRPLFSTRFTASSPAAPNLTASPSISGAEAESALQSSSQADRSTPGAGADGAESDDRPSKPPDSSQNYPSHHAPGHNYPSHNYPAQSHLSQGLSPYPRAGDRLKSNPLPDPTHSSSLPLSAPPVPSSPPAAPLPTATSLFLTLSHPKTLTHPALTQVDGIGLIRSEWFFLHVLEQQPPQHWILQGRRQELVERLRDALLPALRAMSHRPVFYRSFDLRAPDLAHSHPSHHTSPAPDLDSSPLAPDYLSDQAVFDLELEVLGQLYRHPEHTASLRLLLPFVRTLEEVEFRQYQIQQVFQTRRSPLPLWIMAEVPSVLFLLEDYRNAGVQGFVVGCNDLGRLLMGLDRETSQPQMPLPLQYPIVQRAIVEIIQGARALDLPCVVAAPGVALEGEMIRQWVQAGVTAISVEGAAIEQVRYWLAQAEQQIVLAAVRDRGP